MVSCNGREEASIHRATPSKTVAALVLRDLGCAMRNPTVLLCILVAMGASWFFGTVLGDDSQQTAGLEPFLLAFTAILPALESGGVVTLFVMSEEQAHGTYRVMIRGGATLGQIAAGKVIAGCLLSAIATPLCLWLAGFGPEGLPGAAAAGALGNIAPCMLFCSAGLLSDDQMRANFWAGPLVFAGLLPMVGAIEPSLGLIGALSPNGFLAGTCAWAVLGSPEALGMSIGATAASGVAWLALGAIALRAAMGKWKKSCGLER